MLTKIRSHIYAPVSVHFAIFVMLFQLWASRSNLLFPLRVEFIYLEEYIRPTLYAFVIVLAVLRMRWIWILGALTCLLDIAMYFEILLHREAALRFVTNTMVFMKLAQILITTILIPFLWMRTRFYFLDQPMTPRMSTTSFKKLGTIFAVVIVTIGFGLFVLTTNMAKEVDLKTQMKTCWEEGACWDPETEKCTPPDLTKVCAPLE